MKKEQIRTVIAASRQGQISWVSGWDGGGQGTERRKDNLELEPPHTKAGKYHSLYLNSSSNNRYRFTTVTW